MNTNHERINHLEPNPLVPRRLLQSTNIPANRSNMNNLTQRAVEKSTITCYTYYHQWLTYHLIY